MHQKIIITSEDCKLHDMGAGQVEIPARLDVIMKEMAQENCTIIEATTLDENLLHLAHDRDFISFITQQAATTTEDNRVMIIDDLWLNPYSLPAALKSAGGCVQAVDLVMTHETPCLPFVITRPPGHHAESNRAMGFCVFNSAAIAAIYAIEHYDDINNVAVVDFDVHHGNGTQQIFWQQQNLFYASTHEMPNYPGTGYRDETGRHEQIINRPYAPNTPANDIVALWKNDIIPFLEKKSIDLLIISAGFDAHINDPLSSATLEHDDFYLISHHLGKYAAEYCQAHVFSLLEGGYNLNEIGKSAQQHYQGLYTGVNHFS